MKCPHCREKIQDGATKCKCCREFITSTPPDNENDNKPLKDYGDGWKGTSDYCQSRSMNPRVKEIRNRNSIRRDLKRQGKLRPECDVLYSDEGEALGPIPVEKVSWWVRLFGRY